MPTPLSILIPSGSKVLVGVSGGADSVYLLHMLVKARSELGFELIAAHYNHGIRGAAADADERFVVEMCARLGVECRVGRGDVPGYARAHSLTLEQAGRILRYRFFREQGCDLIAVAHHMDDQAESLLMHLARGTGLRGLCGMPDRHGDIIRPLLGMRRAQIEASLAERGIPYRTDATNLVPDGTRNFLRLEIVPRIAEHINPRFVESLSATASRLSADEEYLESLATDALYAARVAPDRYAIAAVAALPAPLRFRAISFALHRAGITADIDAKHIDLITAFLSAPGRGIDLPHARLECESGTFRFVKTPAVPITPSTESAAPTEIPLPLNTPTEFCGHTFTATLVPAGRFDRDPLTAYLDAATLDPAALTLRTRRHGDRFRPVSAPGSKKLSDLLIDRKIPRSDRDRLPLVCIHDGTICFIPTIGIADAFRVTPQTAAILRITCTEV